MKCIVCRKDLKNLPTGEDNHPSDGVAFQSHGNYGSTVFDPMDGTYLEINICDPCLSQAGMEGNVMMGFPQPAPPRGALCGWPLIEVDSEVRKR